MAVDIFGPELFVPRIADIVGFQHHLPWKFSLHAPIVVVHVGIADALRKDDSSQDCDVWAEWRPPSEISGGLRTDALTGIGRRTGERGCRTTGRTTRRGTGRGIVNGRVHVTVQEVIDEVKGVVWEIPARVGGRIV